MVTCGFPSQRASNAESFSNICHDILCCFQAHVCFVDIDSGLVELPEDLPAFPQHTEIRDELLMHLNFQLNSISSLGLSRDSGFRESWAGGDSGLSSEAGSLASSTWSLTSKLELLQHSEALAKITDLAKRTGVIASFEDISESLVLESDHRHRHGIHDRHLEELISNQYLREIFLHYFLQVSHVTENCYCLSKLLIGLCWQSRNI